MGKSFDIELKELRPKLLALTRKFCRCAHLDSEPEDIVQDVLFKLWKTWQSGTEIKNSEAWAVRATKNASISCWRKKVLQLFHDFQARFARKTIFKMQKKQLPALHRQQALKKMMPRRF